MHKNVFFLLLVIIFVFFSCAKKLEDSVPFIMIEGIKHIQNSAEPLRGTVILEVEKKLEIDPYEQEDVGLNYYFSVKDKNGDIIMFDPNQSEAQRFSDTGEYKGNMIRIGQGPGEFVPMRGIRVYLARIGCHYRLELKYRGMIEVLGPLILSPSPVDLLAELSRDKRLHLTKHIASNKRNNDRREISGGIDEKNVFCFVIMFCSILGSLQPKSETKIRYQS